MKGTDKIKQAGDIAEILKEQLGKSSNFFNDLAFNMAKGFGESKFVKSIKVIEIEYTSGSTTLKAKIQLKDINGVAKSE